VLYRGHLGRISAALRQDTATATAAHPDVSSMINFASQAPMTS